MGIGYKPGHYGAFRLGTLSQMHEKVRGISSDLSKRYTANPLVRSPHLSLSGSLSLRTHLCWNKGYRFVVYGTQAACEPFPTKVVGGSALHLWGTRCCVISLNYRPCEPVYHSYVESDNGGSQKVQFINMITGTVKMKCVILQSGWSHKLTTTEFAKGW